MNDSPVARLGIYLDQRYWRVGEEILAERSFVVFLNEVGHGFSHATVFGRLADPPVRGHYRLSPSTRFVALPGYSSGARPWDVVRAMPRSLIAFWRGLADVDVVWLLGPSLLAIAFALAGAIRRRSVVLGVRQDLPRYARARHPRRRAVHIAADLLDAIYRRLARRCPVVVVGRELARLYTPARSLLTISVSLIPRADIVAGPPDGRSFDADELVALSVGRLDAEKNPLMLADVLERLVRADARWRLVVCGDGPCAEPLRRRFDELGVAERGELRGHVTLEDGLRELYERSHALLHVSWTEGVPQVLLEAFAAGLPVVATDVGGVAEAADGAAVLVAPGDPGAAATALLRVAADQARRDELIARGLERIRSHTLESEAAQVARFLVAAGDTR